MLALLSLWGLLLAGMAMDAASNDDTAVVGNSGPPEGDDADPTEGGEARAAPLDIEAPEIVRMSAGEILPSGHDWPAQSTADSGRVPDLDVVNLLYGDEAPSASANLAPGALTRLLEGVMDDIHAVGPEQRFTTLDAEPLPFGEEDREDIGIEDGEILEAVLSDGTQSEAENPAGIEAGVAAYDLAHFESGHDAVAAPMTYDGAGEQIVILFDDPTDPEPEVEVADIPGEDKTAVSLFGEVVLVLDGKMEDLGLSASDIAVVNEAVG